MDSLIITCAGTGSRMGLGYNKMLYRHQGEYIFNITLAKFLQFDQFKEIFVTVNEEDYDLISKSIIKDARIKILKGGATRQASVYEGVRLSTGKYTWVHDGARAMVSPELIATIFEATKSNHDAFAVCVEPKDSLRMTTGDYLTDTINREKVAIMQTPQLAKTEVLKASFENIIAKNLVETDEVGILLSNGYQVEKIKGSYANIKITTPEDLRLLDE